MSTLEGLGVSSPAATTGQASTARAGGVRAVRGASLTGGPANDGALLGFDPVSALAEAAFGASSPPAAGLTSRLMDWAAPTSRQFDSISPSRLMPLLSLAVDRLADEAHRSDEMGQLGAVALTRELQDHRALAERRATLIES